MSIAVGSPTFAQLGPAESQPSVRIDEARIVPDTTSTVGRMSAGKLCLPSGVVRLSDFVANQRELKLVAQAAADEVISESPITGARSSLRVAISIEAIDAKFCQRKYGAFGMGDRRSLTGHANFQFAWRTLDAPAAPWIYQTVEVRPAKGEARTLEQFLPEALRLLISGSILTAR